eukprot:5230960-Pleurochrysis_carterae.AAC.4
MPYHASAHLDQLLPSHGRVRERGRCVGAHAARRAAAAVAIAAVAVASVATAAVAVAAVAVAAVAAVLSVSGGGVGEELPLQREGKAEQRRDDVGRRRARALQRATPLHLRRRQEQQEQQEQLQQ